MIRDAFGSTMDDLRTSVRRRSRMAALSLVLIASGLGSAAAGSAAGAVLVMAGVGLSALIDRRLPLLYLALVLPGSTQFHAIPAFSVGGSTVDFRLLLTAGIGVVLGIQLVALRPRWDPVSVVFATFVAILVFAVPLNEYAPLRSLAPIARAGDALLAYMVARRVVRAPGDAVVIALAIVAGMLPAAASGLIQIVTGDALVMNDAARLSGVYRTSPVGLGMAMQIALLILWGAFLWRPLSRLSIAAFALVFAVVTFVMVETATRLVFASSVLGLALIEICRPRLGMAALVVVVSGCVLFAQPQLSGRLASTLGSVATPAPSSATASPGPAGPDQEGTPGDPSLRYRLFVWTTMIPEWTRSPIVGRGTGSFAVLFERQGNQEREVAHNDYVSILVENGLLGLFVYLGLQLTVLVMLVLRTRLQYGLVRDLAITAAVLYFCLNIVSVLNNPIFFLDLQVLVWMLVGSALALSPDALGVVVLLQPRATGRVRVITDLAHALAVIWNRRPAILATGGTPETTSPHQPLGYRIASWLSDIPLQKGSITE